VLISINLPLLYSSLAYDRSHKIIIKIFGTKVTGFIFTLGSDFVTLSFEERFLEGKTRDTSCAFYKIQQTLVKNPGALSQEEVMYV